MTAFTDLKAKARGALHEYMARPASYYADPAVEPPFKITVRVHDKPVQIGDLAGTNLNYAETHDREETILFWRDELVTIFGLVGGKLEHPARGAMVVLADDEAYYVDNSKPRDGLSITAQVVRAPVGDIVGKTLPDDAVAVLPSESPVWESEDW